ncbi:hypothetical protein SELR_pSRC300840 (plasmid) [Selenomonas ruminantium subsp. lactilytica TAM6421]|uniref:Uncharacterized protein n=1 Tax=Selenomonas ruminantium subsp. lactilytica (strain NBRC 103574 / TAM6421) TaxID=927704 RepID=I0GWM0_SELRL|nr:hypothetical protein [Selenomonas ruminantium]BAL85157.1 hypothetical protein SELR_pSRC300840 [Selenomonas ruminantium subsp. lactilytica TAM6421]
MSDKLYIGQHVRVKKDTSEVQLEGKVGVIVGGNNEAPLVEFYGDFPGHNGGLGDAGLLREKDSCWMVNVDKLEPLSKKETALYALGVREGVPFEIKRNDGEFYGWGPYTLENGEVYDGNHDDLTVDELKYLFQNGSAPVADDDTQEILQKIETLTEEIDELAEELNQIREDLMED